MALQRQPGKPRLRKSLGELKVHLLKLLVIGAGGREHALAWALAQSPQVEAIFVAPGNAGTSWPASAQRAVATNVAIAVDDLPALLQFAQQQAIDLTVVGPELPLTLGIVDQFQQAGLRIFGPSQAASQLEASKGFAKTFMQAQGISTAAFATFREYEEACDYVVKQTQRSAAPTGLVVKADGLAAGKGVFVCSTADEAFSALHTLMVERTLGAAGETVVIEARLSGPEVSLLAFSDGVTVAAMPPARDHKRIFDGDQGPNTGGMGAYAPTPDVDAGLVAQLVQTVLQPAVAGMAQRGTPYVGVLYAGVMLTPQGSMTLEFNCRFGDPETQVLLPLITNLLDVIQACLDQRLDQVPLQTIPGACATVVLAAPGYPGAYPVGLPITGLDAPPAHPKVHHEDLIIFQAGTTRKQDQVVTAGGRVLAVSGRGDDLATALARAYAGVQQIHFEGMHYRKDIGAQAV
ncbi:phosphoribosylamine--glycine ligase [soil metagenome]